MDKEDREAMEKLNAMRIATTFIEGQEMKVNQEKIIKIADKFLKWLKK